MNRLAVILSTLLLISGNTRGQGALYAANHFIDLLSNEQKLASTFPFEGEERYNYHFVPLERKGITFNEMNPEQQKAALDLMRTCMGAEGFKKTRQIMHMEAVLKELENRKPEDHFRDSGNYHISIFGIPSEKTIWGWRFEGHHVSYNFAFNKSAMVSGTPGFMGSNPAIVLSGPAKGTQILREETDRGFALLHALSLQQRKKATIDTAAYKDIITFDKRQALIEHPAGIRYGELNPQQQELLRQLIGTYVHRYTKLFAEDMLKEIQSAGLENLWFSWAGGWEQKIGLGTYYRVQGPTFIIEYDNTQNNANHIHSVLRDLTHDFGGDELLEHYKKDHGN